MEQLTEHSSFVVKESVVLNLVIGVVSLVMFLSAFFEPVTDEGFQFKVTYLMLVPAVLFFIKGLSNRTCMVINRQGLYHYGKLVTNWDNFIDAVVTQDPRPGSIQDRFVLLVRYRMYETRVFQSKIALPNTQNKAEEEIIEAIRFFSTRAWKTPAVSERSPEA